MSDADLLATVTRAFANRVLPERVPVTENPEDWEGRDMEKFFRGKAWEQLTAADLRREGQVDQFFTAEAYAYFLPAYLTQAILNPDELDVCVDHIAWRFDPEEGNAWATERAQKVLGILSGPELGALLDYLRYANHRWNDATGSYRRAIATVEAEVGLRRTSSP